ncbi:MAG: hypothetical protein AAF845_12620 [Bacteroidota bacterium]
MTAFRLGACAALAVALAASASALPLAPTHNPLLDRLGVADAQIRLTGPTTTTSTSGSGGTSNGLLTSDDVRDSSWQSSHAILSRISIAEAGDNPCALRGRYWRSPSAWSWNETQSVVGCDNETGFRHSDEGYSRRMAGRQPDSNNPTAIRGLQVCTNDRSGRNLKLKGLRVFMATVNQDGSGQVTPDAGLTDAFERPNCRTWTPRVTCPSGQVGVGLKVYYHNGQNDRGRNAQTNPDRITGLALQCRAVSITNPPALAPRGRG